MGGRGSLCVYGSQILIVFISQVVRTSATVLDRGGKSDVRCRLREVEGIQLIILDGTLNGLRGGDVNLRDFASHSRCIRSGNGGLQMVFLFTITLILCGCAQLCMGLGQDVCGGKVR